MLKFSLHPFFAPDGVAGTGDTPPAQGGTPVVPAAPVQPNQGTAQPSGDPVSTGTPNTVPPTPPVKPSYSTEELNSLLSDPEARIDPDRLPPALKTFRNNLLTDYTRKTQALAEERKRLEQQGQNSTVPREPSVPQQPGQPVQGIDEVKIISQEARRRAAEYLGIAPTEVDTDFDQAHRDAYTYYFNNVTREYHEQMASVRTQQQEREQKLSVFNSVMQEEASKLDPATFQQVNAYADVYASTLPHSEWEKFVTDLVCGDPEVVRRRIAEVKDAYYTQNRGAVKTPPNTAPAGYPVNPAPQAPRPIDGNTFRGMTPQQKAEELIRRGLVRPRQS